MKHFYFNLYIKANISGRDIGIVPNHVHFNSLRISDKLDHDVNETMEHKSQLYLQTLQRISHGLMSVCNFEFEIRIDASSQKYFSNFQSAVNFLESVFPLLGQHSPRFMAWINQYTNDNEDFGMQFLDPLLTIQRVMNTSNVLCTLCIENDLNLNSPYSLPVQKIINWLLHPGKVNLSYERKLEIFVRNLPFNSFVSIDDGFGMLTERLAEVYFC